VETVNDTQGAIAEGKERVQGGTAVGQHVTGRATNSVTQAGAPGAAQRTASGWAGGMQVDETAAHWIG